MSIKVNNLTKIYGQQKAVDHISFEIHKGEIVGFLGPNGAGKSTTMKIISCYTLPTSGTVEVNNFNILTDPINVRRQIGYLPEQNPLYDEMYIKEFLYFTANIYHVKNPVKKTKEIIEMTGLLPEIHKKIGQLSKGYRQRVGLAQVLIHDPEVLILDEPTSGLDPNQIIEIRNLIREIGKEKTIILSSHILQEVQAMCNRIMIINKGKIIADDTAQNLMNKSLVRFQLIVQFKNPVSKEQLLKIDEIQDAMQKENKWIITASNDNIREKLFNFAVNNNNTLLEMNTLNENLEKIFQELTM